MNPITVSYAKKCKYAEDFASWEETVEMLYYAGMIPIAETGSYAGRIWECMKQVYAKYLNLESAGAIPLETQWMDRLINGLCIYDGEKLIDRESFDRQNFEDVSNALSCVSNVGVFGFELIDSMMDYATEETLDCCKAILSARRNGVRRRAHALLSLAEAIKKRGRIAEAAAIAQERDALLRQIGDFL